jgi:hypothetical protein
MLDSMLLVADEQQRVLKARISMEVFNLIFPTGLVATVPEPEPEPPRGRNSPNFASPPRLLFRNRRPLPLRGTAEGSPGTPGPPPRGFFFATAYAFGATIVLVGAMFIAASP